MLIDDIKGYRHIIWDWNGTLLDDVSMSVDAMNSLLGRRALPLLDLEKYKDIITFPVKDYYARLGFDFNTEPFERLSHEFIAEFNSEKYKFKLYEGTEKVLNFTKNLGISQSILSATREPELLGAVSKLHISQYFVKVAGLSDHYAESKVKRGMDLLVDLGCKPVDVLLIGDTIHDYEVAKELQCDCLLICNGHQSYRRLLGCNASIIESILDVIDFVKGRAIA